MQRDKVRIALDYIEGVADFGYDFYLLAIAKLLHGQYFRLLDFYFHTLIQQRHIEHKFQVLHPLASEKFSTNGVDLFIEKYASLFNASEYWRTDLKSTFNIHFQRIEFDKNGFAMKLFPFTASQEENNPRIVVIDPRIAFGRLVIAETGIPTTVLAQRLKAGESIQDLACDYKCDRLKIEEAIRCELPAA
jgi:uncharacterized protein (DUF433 family)